MIRGSHSSSCAQNAEIALHLKKVVSTSSKEFITESMLQYAIMQQLFFVVGQSDHLSGKLYRLLWLSEESPKGQGNGSAENFSRQQDCKGGHYFYCCNETRQVETFSLVLELSFLEDKNWR